MFGVGAPVGGSDADAHGLCNTYSDVLWEFIRIEVRYVRTAFFSCGVEVWTVPY